MSKKARLDLALVERGLAPTRQVAQSLILRGDVLVNDVVHDKAGAAVAPDAEIRIRGELSKFVGRGGDKINPIFDHFAIHLNGRVVLDVGASTGGFTDAMLQRGAALVYAVDVGYNQLAEKLRRDERVRVYEKTHAKDLTSLEFDPRPNFATMDVSFISVRKILSSVVASLGSPWELLVLVKPQFELERAQIEKGGVVRDPENQRQSVVLVSEWFVSAGYQVVGNVPAALSGAKKGNQEYFVYARG